MALRAGRQRPDGGATAGALGPSGRSHPGADAASPGGRARRRTSGGPVVLGDPRGAGHARGLGLHLQVAGGVPGRRGGTAVGFGAARVDDAGGTAAATLRRALAPVGPPCAHDGRVLHGRGRVGHSYHAGGVSRRGALGGGVALPGAARGRRAGGRGAAVGRSDPGA
eukprot:4743759-Lingulodinium_polyedra.AAC.1